ncbi:MAG: AsmA family protein [Candidatus Omnitrophica bacterium]|nr:AsmA family protein [Candidatus Omnitrophota bacterium]MCM8770344.1 AsmA family protein [Candidatus Omnitrophota bacterium]
MKKVISLLVIIIGLGWLVFTNKDNIVKGVIEKTVGRATGLKLDIASLDFGLLKTEITIKDLRLSNPEGFKEPFLLFIPHIYLDYDFARLIKKNIYIENMELDLKELFVIRDKNGNLNLSALKPLAAKDKAALPQTKKESPAIKIDEISLKLGKVIYKDYTKDANNPSIQEFNLNFSGRYSQITDLESLVKLIVREAMFKTALDKISGLDLEGLKDIATNIISEAQEGQKKIFPSSLAR